MDISFLKLHAQREAKRMQRGFSRAIARDGRGRQDSQPRGYWNDESGDILGLRNIALRFTLIVIRCTTDLRLAEGNVARRK